MFKLFMIYEFIIIKKNSQIKKKKKKKKQTNKQTNKQTKEGLNNVRAYT